MAYIGNTPAENYASFLTETFSVSATVNYTLSHAVTNENDIRLVINGVVQQPGSGKAYTASGTTLTLTSATVSGDVMYAVYLGRALQTVNPPNASVGTAQLADSSVTSAKLASGAVANTPAFEAYRSSSDQSVSDNSYTKVQFNTETFDTDSAYDNSTNYRFTPQIAGKYFVYASVIGNSQASSNLQEMRAVIYKNGSLDRSTLIDFRTNYARTANVDVQAIIDMNGSSDYIEIYARVNDTSGDPKIDYDSDGTYFGAYKIIT